jgi:hypothetical protein
MSLFYNKSHPSIPCVMVTDTSSHQDTTRICPIGDFTDSLLFTILPSVLKVKSPGDLTQTGRPEKGPTEGASKLIHEC